MQLIIDGEEWYIDPERIKDDLRSDDTELHCISKHGEMVLDCLVDGALKRELWQARPTGYPSPALNVGGMDFEFVRSIPIGAADA